MDAAQRAMTTWLGALARGGVIAAHASEDATAGEAVAAYVVGEERLEELRAHFEDVDPAEAAGERRAAVEAVIAMAQSDRDLHPEETHSLRSLVGKSGLDADTQDELVMLVHEPKGIEGIEERLTHPVLRELILALSWELAVADGKVDDAESEYYARLTERLGVKARRAKEIADAIAERVG